MSLVVLNKGVQSIPVDLGRKHFQHLGVTVGGPMDLHAYLWANYLVGNASHAAQIEICHGHFSAAFTLPATFALSGANLYATLNGNAINSWRSFSVSKGDRLTLNGPQDGFYAYLAVAGGFAIAPQLGSICAVPRDALGGLGQNGLGINNGDRIAYKVSNSEQVPKSMPPKYIPNYSTPLSLGVIPSYQHALFSVQQQQALYKQPFTVSERINRQGTCLQGEAIQYTGPQLTSEGIALGSIQIPPDGQPIVLMRDRQSIGGYPKLGCVTSLDTGQLAQRRSGDIVTFEPTSLTAARNSYQRLLRFFSGNTHAS